MDFICLASKTEAADKGCFVTTTARVLWHFLLPAAACVVFSVPCLSLTKPLFHTVQQCETMQIQNAGEDLFFPSDSHFHGSWPIRSEPKLHFKSFHLAHDFQTRSEPWDCQGWVGYPLSKDYRHCCRLLVPVSPPHQSLSFTSFIRAIATIERIVLKETSDTLTVYSKRQDSCQ